MSDYELKITIPIGLDEAKIKAIREAADALREIQKATSGGGGGGGGGSRLTGLGAATAGLPGPQEVQKAKLVYNSLRDVLQTATGDMRRRVAEYNDLTKKEKALLNAVVKAGRDHIAENKRLTSQVIAQNKERSKNQAQEIKEAGKYVHALKGEHRQRLKDQNQEIKEAGKYVHALKKEYKEEMAARAVRLSGLQQSTRHYVGELSRLTGRLGEATSRFGLSMGFVVGGGSRFLRPLFVGFANFMRLAQTAVGGIGGLFGRGLGGAVGGIFGPLGATIGNAIGNLVGQVAGAVTAALGAVTILWAGAVRLWFIIVSNVVKSIAKVLQTLVSIAGSIVRGIIGAFTSLVSALSSIFGRVFNAVSRWMNRIAMVATGVVALSIRQFAKLDQAIGKSAAQTVGVGGANRAQLTGQAISLARQYRQDPERVAQTMFEPISAGMTDLASIAAVTGEALRLTIAGGMEDSTIAAKALVATMRALGSETQDVERIASVLFAAQAVGIGNIEDFAKQFRRLVPAARSVSISLEQVATATALVSQMTGGAEVGFRGLEFLMRDITNVVRKARQEFGSYTIGLKLTKEGGIDLFGILLAIRQEMEKLPVGQRVAAKRNIFQQQRMSAAAAAFMDMPMSQLGMISGRVANASAGYQAAYKDQEKAFWRSMDGIKSAIKVFGDVLGGAMSGVAGRVLNAISNFLGKITDHIQTLASAGYFDRLADSTLRLVNALAQLLTGDLNFKRWSDALLSFIENIPQKLDAITDKVREWASKGGIVAAFKEIGSKILSAISDTALGTVGASVGRIGARAFGAGAEGYRAAQGYDPNQSVNFGGMWKELISAIGRISRWDFMGAVVQVIEAISRGWISYFPLFRNFTKGILDAFKWLTDSILSLGELLATAYSAITGFLGLVAQTMGRFTAAAVLFSASDLLAKGGQRLAGTRQYLMGGEARVLPSETILYANRQGAEAEAARRNKLADRAIYGVQQEANTDWVVTQRMRGVFDTVNETFNKVFDAVDESVKGWLPKVVDASKQMAGAGDMAVTQYNLWLRYQQKLLDETAQQAQKTARLAAEKKREQELVDFETSVLKRAAALVKNVPPGGEYDLANLRGERARQIHTLGVSVRTGKMSGEAYRNERVAVDQQFRIVRQEQEARKDIVQSLKDERRERRLTMAEFDRQLKARLAAAEGTKTERGFDNTIKAMIGINQADLRAQRLGGMLSAKQYRQQLRGVRGGLLAQEGGFAIKKAEENLGLLDLSAIGAVQGGEGSLRRLAHYRTVAARAKAAPAGSPEWNRAQAELRTLNERFASRRGAGLMVGFLKKQDDLTTREEKLMDRKEKSAKDEEQNIQGWAGVGAALGEKIGADNKLVAGLNEVAK